MYRTARFLPLSQALFHRGYDAVGDGRGLASETLEIVEELPQLEAILVPIGGDSVTSGACIVAQTVNPHIELTALYVEKAPAVYLSWKERHNDTTEKTEIFGWRVADPRPTPRAPAVVRTS